MTSRPAGDGLPGLRAQIALSWRRASTSGLGSSDSIDGLEIYDIDRSSRLMVAATPVLDALSDNLSGTRFSVMLADRVARVSDIRAGVPLMRSLLEQAGAVVGRLFDESATGTNSIATTHELRQGVAVRGGEHYLDVLKPFSCYGHPIVNPTSGRLEGVLDITCLAGDDTDLLGPFVRRAVQDIQRRLADMSGTAQLAVMSAFRQASARRPSPLVAFGPDVVLTSPAAADLLDGADLVALRMWLDEPGWSPNGSAALVTGRAVVTRVTRIDGVSGAWLVELAAIVDPAEPADLFVPAGACGPVTVSVPDPADQGDARAGRPSPRRTIDAVLAGVRDRRARILLVGEPGTGRTTALTVLAGPGERLVFDAADAPRDPRWVERIVGALDGAGERLVAVENIHLLDPATAVLLTRALRRTPAWVALTGRDALSGDLASLAATCAERVELPTLRACRRELPVLVGDMLTRRHPEGRLRFSAEALRMLAQQPWPGNFRELAQLVDTVAAGRTTGVIGVRDLPASYRTVPPLAEHGSLARAEYDAIVTALAAAGGNKVRAAALLGISRSTLYQRMRALHLW